MVRFGSPNKSANLPSKGEEMPLVLRPRACSVEKSRRSLIERLETRQLLAAHVIGSPTVYATIQAAVDAALPGGTVQVDAGNYHEMVTVSKSLTLRGAPGGASVVDGQPIGAGRSSAFFVTASDVTIDGFTVQG